MILAKGNSVTLDGKDYSLVQFLFLTPSEHTISGKQYALEVHFVNMAADVELAAFGVLGDVLAQLSRKPSITLLPMGAPPQRLSPWTPPRLLAFILQRSITAAAYRRK